MYLTVSNDSIEQWLMILMLMANEDDNYEPLSEDDLELRHTLLDLERTAELEQTFFAAEHDPLCTNCSYQNAYNLMRNFGCNPSSSLVRFVSHLYSRFPALYIYGVMLSIIHAEFMPTNGVTTLAAAAPLFDRGKLRDSVIDILWVHQYVKRDEASNLPGSMLHAFNTVRNYIRLRFSTVLTSGSPEGFETLKGVDNGFRLLR